jgi:DNA repair ATPase RecN
MKRFFGSIVIFMALLTIGLAPCSAEAQNAGPKDNETQDMARSFGMDPALCDGLQVRIDKVVNIYRSSSKDDDKISQLTEALAQSLRNMRESGHKDPEVDRIVKQYLTIMEGLPASARDAFKAGDKQLSPDAQKELQKLKIMTATYVSMMKMMCPKLVLPDALDK